MSSGYSTAPDSSIILAYDAARQACVASALHAAEKVSDIAGAV